MQKVVEIDSYMGFDLDGNSVVYNDILRESKDLLNGFVWISEVEKLLKEKAYPVSKDSDSYAFVWDHYGHTRIFKILGP